MISKHWRAWISGTPDAMDPTGIYRRALRYIELELTDQTNTGAEDLKALKFGIGAMLDYVDSRL